MFVTSKPPAVDTLEVSLFGTGVGEALAVHIGNGEWMMVDSCKSSTCSEPLGLAYLRSIGVDPAKSVKFIVATHWHDDHVNGLNELVEQCRSSQLVFSQALAADEFRCIVGSFSTSQISFDRNKSGVREMGDCLNTLLRRKEVEPGNYYPPIRTQADHRFFRRGDCEISSISPSPGAIHSTTQEIATMWHAMEIEACGGNGPRPSPILST